MGCDCKSPCGRYICCGICELKHTCDNVCPTCVPTSKENLDNPRTTNSNGEENSQEE